MKNSTKDIRNLLEAALILAGSETCQSLIKAAIVMVNGHDKKTPSQIPLMAVKSIPTGGDPQWDRKSSHFNMDARDHEILELLTGRKWYREAEIRDATGAKKSQVRLCLRRLGVSGKIEGRRDPAYKGKGRGRLVYRAKEVGSDV